MSITRGLSLLALCLPLAHASEVIIQTNDIQKTLSQLSYTSFEEISPIMGIYLVKDSQKSPDALLSGAKKLSTVKNAMLNRVMQLRAVPNDPSYSNQWGPAKISAPAAWNLGTGGKNPYGQDIVVAVVDNGVDITHEDLKNNVWVNTHEIPGNNIDDDGNGYVDDVNGWNAYNDNAQIPKGVHGTHVAGIVGAEGDNGKHVAGVNWDVKIMAVAASSGETALVLKGYNYVLKQKLLWLQTDGAQGANVVSTNSSFGVDAANCQTEEYKLWNEIYETMGRAGILSAAATANQNWNIDQIGDVPTSCISDYLVAVTNTTKTDTLYTQAGWGKIHVDLGAPGTDVLSSIPGNLTRNMTGTSMATPHVAGAIAFLHSVASPGFANICKTDPARAAKELKRIMLETVDKIPALQDKTLSGGRLNLQKAAEAISRY